MAKRTDAAEEAILLASAAPDVRSRLELRAAKASELGMMGGWPEGREKTESELLERGDRLIDLTLAEYCLSHSTARTLFERDLKDWPVRSLVLGNEAMGGVGFESMPQSLMGGEKGLLSFLRRCTKEEAWVLFANPTLDDDFLEKFLDLQKSWQVMREEVRLAALAALAINPKMQRSRNTAARSNDGWSEFKAGMVSEKAWLLIERLEPSDKVAGHLAQLYAKMSPDTYKTDGTLAALQKWIATSEEAIVGEAKNNAGGWLSPYQTIRHAAACMLIAQRHATKEQFIDSGDVALRCAAYQHGKITIDQIGASVERDGALAIRHLIYNDSNWWNDDHREELRRQTHLAEEETLGWDYRYRDERHRIEHPNWFESGETSPEPEDKLLTESSIPDLVMGVVDGIADVPAAKALSTAIDRLAKAQRLQFWILMAAVAVLLLRL